MAKRKVSATLWANGGSRLEILPAGIGRGAFGCQNAAGCDAAAKHGEALAGGDGNHFRNRGFEQLRVCAEKVMDFFETNSFHTTI